jgi:hypothetical protein
MSVEGSAFPAISAAPVASSNISHDVFEHDGGRGCGTIFDTPPTRSTTLDTSVGMGLLTGFVPPANPHALVIVGVTADRNSGSDSITPSL